MTTEKPCSTHPEAPHGFVRNASYNAGHYVCECSGWTPPDPKSLQERLRDGADICHARKIYTDFAGIAEEAADRIDTLEELNAQLREQNDAVDAACAYLERQIDALEAEVAEYRKCADDQAMAYKVERDGLMEQVAALTKDAARYHWLREHTMPKPLPMVRVQVMYQGQYILRDGPELDADVDNRIAAIAAQKAQIK